MSMRAHAIGGLALLLALGLAPGRTSAEAQETTPDATIHCADCHDQAKAFLSNPHATEVKDGVVENAVCETCHGNGAAHMEAGGDKTLITKPQGRAGADICLTCHDRPNNHRSSRMGFHANSEAVNCLSCHTIHHAKTNEKLLVNSDPALCGTCHGTQAASFRNKPYTHRMGRAGLGCATCHEPHGRPDPVRNNLRRTTAEELPCLGCHADKRGPYVFPHGGTVIGDCTNCHEPHGSSNPKQLKRAFVFQLCLECHSPITSDTLGSQPPAFHNINSPRFQNCTTCHVAVHGSNRSPALLK